VVRELANLHHGRTWIDDATSDGGTRVVIELPA
jgi:signal transduction histidine kinase